MELLCSYLSSVPQNNYKQHFEVVELDDFRNSWDKLRLTWIYF